MMNINANTKIAAILKQHPDALEAIISISPKFIKLRNPLLRKLMASRTSISMASKVAGCHVNDFFEKLKTLGFFPDNTVLEKEEAPGSAPLFMQHIKEKVIVELDVRPVIESGKDPFNIITGKIKHLQNGEVLKLVNSFEPVPLIQILSKQGFEYYVETINENLVNTYFHKIPGTSTAEALPAERTGGWNELIKRFENKIVTVDVRQLEMPLPMMTILEALEKLAADQALFVYHKRIPMFLLPELAEKKYDYRIKEISEGEVHLLIFKS
ncbi:MAG TPA: DUF2249 domain-containing protein [Chitinophagaceae bacterium]|nr:DUF2249 domain-containing protein [Chitinophagaceae bacterium]